MMAVTLSRDLFLISIRYCMYAPMLTSLEVMYFVFKRLDGLFSYK